MLTLVKIVLATCHSAGGQQLANENFDAVVIDEATQATEPVSSPDVLAAADMAALLDTHSQRKEAYSGRRPSTVASHRDFFWTDYQDSCGTRWRTKTTFDIWYSVGNSCILPNRCVEQDCRQFSNYHFLHLPEHGKLSSNGPAELVADAFASDDLRRHNSCEPRSAATLSVVGYSIEQHAQISSRHQAWNSRCSIDSRKCLARVSKGCSQCNIGMRYVRMHNVR